MSPVKSRREQYSQATKAALIDAATRRFATDGFAGTSLEDIATDIQATRGAVYHHFATKTALFEAVFDALETDMIEQVAAASATITEPWPAALTALSTFLDHCCDPVYGRIVWQEAPIALGWRHWQECEAKYAYGLIESILRALADHGDIQPLPMEPMTHITFHILGSAGMALAEAPDADKPRTKAEYGQVIAQLISGVRR
jgi:AcrR family transcriptional regulator